MDLLLLVFFFSFDGSKLLQVHGPHCPLHTVNTEISVNIALEVMTENQNPQLLLHSVD